MRFTVLIMSLLLAGVTTATAEPIVVLEYSQRGGSDELSDEASKHPFRMDPNYSQSHKVMADETLGHIMQAYYGGSGLNMTFVELAIVQFNRHAFVRANPNFLYADKTLHLPSVNQIQALAVGKKDKPLQNDTYGGRRNEIFFFGG
jgi:Tfp pilus assembly protein FimV